MRADDCIVVVGWMVVLVVIALVLFAASAAFGGQPGSVVLKWKNNSAVQTGFEIYRREGAGVARLIDTANKNAESYTDRNVTEGIVYCYEVVTVSGTEKSNASNTACVNF